MHDKMKMAPLRCALRTYVATRFTQRNNEETIHLVDLCLTVKHHKPSTYEQHTSRLHRRIWVTDVFIFLSPTFFIPVCLP